MTQKHLLLHVGIAEFSEPTLLLIGDALVLYWLADQIDARQELKLAEMPSLVSQTEVNLRLAPATHSGSLTRKGKAFSWEISADEAKQFAQQLRGLAASPGPAHAYLDPESNTSGVQVVASKEEYDLEKIFGAEMWSDSIKDF